MSRPAGYRLARGGGRQRERGMTTLGVLILVVFVGLFVFAGIRLAPIYLEHMKVTSVLEGVKKEFDGQNPSRQEIYNSIEKRFDIESISALNYRDIKVAKVNDGYTVTAQYDNNTPFIANVSFTVSFDKQVMVRP